MQLTLNDTLVQSVWEDSFTDKAGEVVRYWRALVMPMGQAPLQLCVKKDDFEELREAIGHNGDVVIEIDCPPGRKQRVNMVAVA